ncbi:MAG: hypothetical protein ACWGO1_11375 [Anaerolineales bacterium]
MTDEFGTPMTPVQTPPSRNSTPIIIAVVVLVVLCCCCVLIGGGLAWTFGDAVMHSFGVY